MDTFLEKWGGVEQRSAKWRAIINVTVGMSEIATLMGKNKYKTRSELVMEKVRARLGIINDINSPACHWGTIMEDVIKLYIESYFVSKVVGDSICITSKKYPGLRCSPDGYLMAATYNPAQYERYDVEPFLINGRQLYTIHEDMDGIVVDLENVNILLEFKCPLSRTPNVLNETYESQVMGGIALSVDEDTDFRITRHALFVDSLFRKCKLSSLNWTNEYDKTYHNRDYNRHTQTPIACGIIFVYSSAAQTTPAGQQVPQDFGIGGNFDQVMERIVKHEYRIEIPEPWIRARGDVIDLSVDRPGIIGYIPYKLLNTVFTLREYDEYYIARIWPSILDFLAEVESKILNYVPVVEAKSQEAIDEYFT